MPEQHNVEWKTKWKDDYLAWICGFANAQGGKIYIGMNDDGEVVGLDHTRKLLEDIPNKIRSAMSIVVDVNLWVEDDRRSGSTMQVLSGSEQLSKKAELMKAYWMNLKIF